MTNKNLYDKIFEKNVLFVSINIWPTSMTKENV